MTILVHLYGTERGFIEDCKILIYTQNVNERDDETIGNGIQKLWNFRRVTKVEFPDPGRQNIRISESFTTAHPGYSIAPCIFILGAKGSGDASGFGQWSR